MVIEKKTTGNSEIWIDQEGMLILKIKEDAEIDLEEVTNAFRIYSELGAGPNNKMLQLIDAPINVEFSPEARKYSSEHSRNYFIASAVISNSLTIRLLVNFFNSFYKHNVPLKMFDAEENARKWLESFR